MLNIVLFSSQAAGEESICVSVIPCSKSQFFVWPLRFQAEQFPCRIQPSFCNDFNRFATLEGFYMPLQVLSSRRQKWGEQHSSYKLLECKHFFTRHVTQHYERARFLTSMDRSHINPMAHRIYWSHISGADLTSSQWHTAGNQVRFSELCNTNVYNSLAICYSRI